MVAVLVPVLGRPHRVHPLVENIQETTPEPHEILFICDPEDTATQDQVAVTGCRMISPGGSYAHKINAGYEATTTPLFFMAADDLNFHRDWLGRALEYLTDDHQVVGTNDICNPRVMTGQHSTHTLVNRAYIERESGVIDQPNTVLNEIYPHEYTDDEFIQTAMFRGRYAHAFDSIVEHMHMLVGKAPDDDTYRLGRQHTAQSRRAFRMRRRLWTAR